jgi:O-acetyl-ADP-ribose deacetylase
MPTAQLVDGDLLDQKVEVIVNAWNRNIFPWWLLLPQGVSGAIKKRGGYAPFRELARMPLIPLGGAVVTSAGKLNFKAIIHVAGINLLWMGSAEATRLCAENALKIAQERNYASIALPTIGAGTGGLSEAKSVEIIQQVAEASAYSGHVIIVRFRSAKS